MADPGVAGPRVPAPRREVSAPVLLAVALGGGLGGLARYAFAGLGLPGTVAVNVLGSALIGVLVVLVPRLHPLARPFLGVGFLGGFTTFSAYALDAVRLGDLRAGLYLVVVVVLALGATALGMAVTRKVIGRKETG
ncbi:CrcB protein [Saccharothrix tamanrassetensis]|uniref:Fluoride-specific ion channel FluC n=1 Tax=Saccharothrix tamanrassetensis TaxID=1051531 RepID=A0A841CP67_9PSEU|nr:CrcB family protein [Saccharothrix tamanrassetensis]MBB5957867.1 CrcB protein [Saccharothrix tamanrassetensis]